MVDQRANLDYGRDDETPASETTSPVEGDGFTMTDTDLDQPGSERPAVDVDDDEDDDDDHNLEAETLGAP